ncbi:MAG: phosphate signaling complex protein PhoU [Oscillospiraceae bacterium]|jgi:phosphate transport system protein|nr:phosphate signaling complex protein PhoU [Oscillospiraceae bacterium]
MRSRFDEQLAHLNLSLIEMGALIERAISDAVRALEHHDAELAQQVIAGDSVVNDKEKDIESACLKLLLNQQPVARDLRQISTALKMITDMERVGDHAADISELCILLSGQEYITNLVHIPKMADATIKMLGDSIDAFVRKDLALAETVIAYDDNVDELFDVVKRDMIELIRENVENGEQALDLLQIAKYLERIGDHAQNIAEWVVFSITGMHKNKQLL